MSEGHCLNCGTILCCLDEDPNGDQNAVCAKCRAEEAHDFDAEPNAKFGRNGSRIDTDPVPCNNREDLAKLLELHRRKDWSDGDIAFECAIFGAFDNLETNYAELQKNDGELFCKIMVEAIAGIADAAIVAHKKYDGRWALSVVQKLRAESERNRKKWRDYEDDYVLPTFKWAEEMGFDLHELVREAKGNCVVRFFEKLRADLKKLQREKDARMYYQEIVYRVCTMLDNIYGKKPGHGVVCGTLETPSDEVQKTMRALYHFVEELRSDVESFKICLAHDVKCPTCVQDMSEGRVPSSIYNEIVKWNKNLNSQLAFAKYAENVQCDECGRELCMVCSKSDLPAQLLVLTEDRDAIRSIVNKQAEDEGLWFKAVTAPEAYLQQGLRRLHQAIEEKEKGHAQAADDEDEHNRTTSAG